MNLICKVSTMVLFLLFAMWHLKTKCKVMQIGVKNDTEKKWSLGENTITSTNKYTYLGDIITADGKNKENLDARMNRIQATTRRVLASASIEVLKSVETKTLLRLHEAYSIPSILTNCEMWVLTKTDTATTFSPSLD